MKNKKVIEVIVLKDLPGLDRGTILKYHKHYGFLPADAIDSDGNYIPTLGWRIISQTQAEKYPDFFKEVYCKCICCCCNCRCHD